LQPQPNFCGESTELTFVHLGGVPGARGL